MRSELFKCCENQAKLMEVKILPTGIRIETKCSVCGIRKIVRGVFEIKGEKIKSVKIHYYKTL